MKEDFPVFNYLITRLLRSLTVFWRTIRAFAVRRCAGLAAFFRRFGNFSRGAAKAANSAARSVLSVSKNPSKREDYVETRRLLISKTLLLKIVLILIAAVLLAVLVIWPFLLSHFLTARFYVEDSRVENWSGRVIVYSDRKKTLPLYAGRLEKGVLQGAGKAYDEAGRLCYEGQFQDGLRSGSGVEYKDGVLVYEGQFALDRREGSGTAYQEGFLLYEGQFRDGLYEGRGKRYERGVLSSEGTFQGGVLTGEGIAYYSDGTASYRGQFAQDACEGTGTAYDRSGGVLYQGGFSAGRYNGEGVLTLAPGQKLEAVFLDGAPDGVVKWSKDGTLYYEGEWAENGPEGFGTLYGKDGTALYQGQFSGGSLDGRWLVSLSAQALRDALGREEESPGRDGGFLIASPSLGLTALCSFQTDGEEAKVHTIYLESPETGGSWVRLMDLTLDAWPEEARRWQGEKLLPAREGVAVWPGYYPAESVSTEDSRADLFFNGDGDVILGVWSILDAPPETLETLAGEQAPPATTEDFLESLDEMAEALPGGGEGEDGGEEKLEVRKLLAACETAEEAKTLAGRLLHWWELDARLLAKENDRARLEALLDEAKTALHSGSGGGDAAALEQDLARTNWEIEQNELELGKLKIELDKVDPARYDLGPLAASFDPTAADAAELSATAAAYAQAVGRETAPEAVEREVKLALVGLTQAHLLAQNALEQYQWCVEAAKSAAGTYAMGGGGKSDWYQALSAQENAQAQVCAALAEFTRQGNELNWLTGGWVSRTFDWFPDIFIPLYEAEIPPAPEKPAEGEKAAETGEPAETGELAEPGETPIQSESENPPPGEGG